MWNTSPKYPSCSSSSAAVIACHPSSAPMATPIGLSSPTWMIAPVTVPLAVLV